MGISTSLVSSKDFLKIFWLIPILLFFIPLSAEAGIAAPTISWNAPPGGYNLNAGEVGKPPVIVTVEDDSVAGAGTVDVTITSKDAGGKVIDEIVLQLKETAPGVFQNDNLIFTSGKALIGVGDTITISIPRDCVMAPPPPPLLPPPPLGGPPLLPLPPPPMTIDYGDCLDTIETLGPSPPLTIPPNTGLTVTSTSSMAMPPLFPILTETGGDTGVFATKIKFSTTVQDPTTNTLLVSPGDIVTITDPLNFGKAANGLIVPNPNPSVGAIEAEIGGEVIATYNPSSSVSIVTGPGPGGGGGGAVRPSLVVDASETSDAGGGAFVEGPTIGTDAHFGLQKVTNGFCWDDFCKTVKKYWHDEMEKLDAENSLHTITLTILPQAGAQMLTDVELGMAPIGSFDLNQAIWKVHIHREQPGGMLLQTIEDMEEPGNWDITINDPDDYIGEEVTISVQVIDGQFVVMSITMDFKKPTATNYALGIHLLDDREASRIFWFNDGVEITDRWEYPAIKQDYEEALDISRVCKPEEDPTDRITCTFANKILSEIDKAEKTLDEIMNQNVRIRYGH